MEVCHINVWGTVCGDSSWGLADAQVACRQLGLPTTGTTTLTVSAVHVDNRVSWLRYVRCVGNESSLFNCTAILAEGYSCFQSNAGVSCQESKSKISKYGFFNRLIWRDIFLNNLTFVS